MPLIGGYIVGVIVWVCALPFRLGVGIIFRRCSSHITINPVGWWNPHLPRCLSRIALEHSTTYLPINLMNSSYKRHISLSYAFAFRISIMSNYVLWQFQANKIYQSSSFIIRVWRTF